MLVYDVNSPESFAAVDGWRRRLAAATDADTTIRTLLVGNKLDLTEQREVQQQDVLDFVAAHNLIHCETSAKTAENVASLFNRICERVKVLQT